LGVYPPMCGAAPKSCGASSRFDAGGRGRGSKTGVRAGGRRPTHALHFQPFGRQCSVPAVRKTADQCRRCRRSSAWALRSNHRGDRMSLLRSFAALLLLFVALPAFAQDVAQAPAVTQTVASASSPSGTLKVDVTLNPEGRVGYQVSRLGKPVIGESRLGFLFTDAPEMLRNFQLAGQSTRSFDETWEEPWGEYRTIRN